MSFEFDGRLDDHLLRDSPDELDDPDLTDDEPDWEAIAADRAEARRS